MAKTLIVALAVAFALGGVGAALSNTRDDANTEPIALEPARKDDVDARTVGAAADDDDGDGDDTAGNDGTSGGNNTAAPAPAPAPAAAGDGDDTAGNDGTSGGDNTAASVASVASAPAPAPPPAPAPAPPIADDSVSAGGASYSAPSGNSGGGGDT